MGFLAARDGSNKDIQVQPVSHNWYSSYSDVDDPDLALFGNCGLGAEHQLTWSLVCCRHWLRRYVLDLTLFPWYASNKSVSPFQRD